jgi:hypothetical protein
MHRNRVRPRGERRKSCYQQNFVRSRLDGGPKRLNSGMTSKELKSTADSKLDIKSDPVLNAIGANACAIVVLFVFVTAEVVVEVSVT